MEFFTNKAYLRIGELAEVGFDLANAGYELATCNYSFNKAIDIKGQTQTLASGGTISISINSIPSNELLEWSLNPRRYYDATIVFCDYSGVPLERLKLQKVTCTTLQLSYSRRGEAYTSTSFQLTAEKMTVGETTIDNEWKNV